MEEELTTQLEDIIVAGLKWFFPPAINTTVTLDWMSFKLRSVPTDFEEMSVKSGLIIGGLRDHQNAESTKTVITVTLDHI